MFHFKENAFRFDFFWLYVYFPLLSFYRKKSSHSYSHIHGKCLLFHGVSLYFTQKGDSINGGVFSRKVLSSNLLRTFSFINSAAILNPSTGSIKHWWWIFIFYFCLIIIYIKLVPNSCAIQSPRSL